MKTDELIVLSRKCQKAEECDYSCPLYYKGDCRQVLIDRLTDKLEMLYRDVNKKCFTCKYYELESNEYPCNKCIANGDWSIWEYRGDTE